MVRTCLTTPSLARCLFKTPFSPFFGAGGDFAAAGSAFGGEQVLICKNRKKKNKLVTHTPSGFDELRDLGR